MSIDSILSNNIHIYPAANRNPEYLGNVLLEENITRQVKNLLDYPSTILNISVNSNFILTWVNDSTLKVVIPSFSCLISGYNIDIKSQTLIFEDLDYSKFYYLYINLNLGEKTITAGETHTKSITVNQIISSEESVNNILDINNEFKGLQLIVSEIIPNDNNILYLGKIFNNSFTLNNYIKSKFNINDCKITMTDNYDEQSHDYIYDNGIIDKKADEIALLPDRVNQLSRVSFFGDIINSGKISNDYNDYIILDDGELD